MHVVTGVLRVLLDSYSLLSSKMGHVPPTLNIHAIRTASRDRAAPGRHRVTDGPAAALHDRTHTACPILLQIRVLASQLAGPRVRGGDVTCPIFGRDDFAITHDFAIPPTQKRALSLRAEKKDLLLTEKTIDSRETSVGHSPQ